MAKYVYPAIFRHENGMYEIIFPDFPNVVKIGRR